MGRWSVHACCNLVVIGDIDGILWSWNHDVLAATVVSLGIYHVLKMPFL